MQKVLLTLTLALITTLAFSQTGKYWSLNNESRGNIKPDKAVARLTYPKAYKLFSLNANPLRQELFSIAGNNRMKASTIISLPNADGNFEEFEVVEASNFEPDLQAQFPDIRAYSGKGITDKHATLKLSISPQGIQSMVFRTESDNEFIEPYSQDHTIYSVYKSHREKGNLPWSCSTDDKQMAAEIKSQVSGPIAEATGSSTGLLKTMRLAQSCNGEYANFFGATSSAQVGLVLAAFNATLSRCNGCYEKDLALHLNLISNTTSVIYYNPSSDPYTTLSNWNLQLQQTLTSVIGSAAYDIGHMFGASGGGGNAGCIGCVCVNPANNSSLAKGSGITSPADGIPQGDNFDIDYVAHEVGHQLGGNHTFSMSLEGTGQNKEIGSGITIMGYAGITSQDVAPHSIDIFHETTIGQIQANLATKSCPVSVAMTANHAPIMAAVSNYTIPISTPFALTGSATDAENDALTYCWEQNDNSTTSGASSVASPTKATGPNWLSFSPVISGTRVFPTLSTILAGLNVTPPLPGGDAGANIEALSSVSRTLNFRLTVRDNSAYETNVKIGQTAFTDAVVTVTNTAGPFAVTAPNTGTTWNAGGTATVTWSVNGTNGGSVNCTSVNILLSTDGGLTFPTVLAASTANDGSEIIAVPSSPGTTNRVKVESVGNIFFDISNANFSIGATPACGDPTGLTASSVTQTTATVSWGAVSGATSYAVDYKASSSAEWISATVATSETSQNLSGLTANTLYDYRVRATCTSGTGNYVQSQFTTAGAPVTCPGTYDVTSNGSISGAATIPLNTDIFGLINVRNDVDYYKFIITTGGSITLTLSALPADYQLDLTNSTGSTLQSSTNGGTANETINRTVTAGTYYARVYPRNKAFNANSCYTLNVQTGTASRNEAGAIVQTISSKLLVSPNPAGNFVTLAFNAAADGNGVISVIAQTGAAISNKKVAINKGVNTPKLYVGNLANGVYFVKIQTGSVIQMAKLVIVK
ncbi:MAG: reprolysin-like metallopeptidase [Ferruginibacter sp.]